MDPFIVVLSIFLVAGTLFYMAWGVIDALSMKYDDLEISGDDEEWS
jgi:hypothetical protein